MAAEFEEADQDLIRLAEEIIAEYHPWLRHAKIGFMFRSEAGKSKGRAILGKARKVSEEQRVFLDFDFIIWIAKDVFMGFNPQQRRALVDHELCHCGGYEGEWKMRAHDFEEFNVILQRYGLWDDTLKLMNEALNQPQLPGVKVELDHAGMVRSVPGNLLERATEDPEGVAADLVEGARRLAAENGGKLTISLLQRKFRIGYSHAASILQLIETAGGEVEHDTGGEDGE